MPKSDTANVRSASRQIVRELGLLEDKFCKSLPSNSQCHILIELDSAGQLSLTELATKLNLDKSTVSRVIGRMIRSKTVKAAALKSDRRHKLFKLTARGSKVLSQVNKYSNWRVTNALGCLSAQEKEQVIVGLGLYAKSLRLARVVHRVVIRPIRKSDDKQVAKIIRTVMPEFGLSGPHCAISDPEVDAMTKYFSAPRSMYLVLELAGKVVGGGGVAPLKGGSPQVCELQKMYFLPEVRGLGLGKNFIKMLLDKALELGFTKCYLETVYSMKAANHLYESFGFKEEKRPLGCTGHSACNRWMTLTL